MITELDQLAEDVKERLEDGIKERDFYIKTANPECEYWEGYVSALDWIDDRLSVLLSLYSES